jgi:hypothetical protein
MLQDVNEIGSFLLQIQGIMGMKGIIKKKQDERKLQFRALESQPRYQLNDEHERILALSNDELTDLLQKRKLTAVKVLEAFMAKVNILFLELLKL